MTPPVELAPQHKSGLYLRSPILTAAGCGGFADEYGGLIDFSALGAFVTNPITLRARQPARKQHALPTPGGVLLHTGLPNPGLRRAIRDYAPRWLRMACPVIVHLAVTVVEDVERAVELLEGVDNVAGVELGFRDDEEKSLARAAIAAAVSGMLPVIVRVPFLRAAEFVQAASQGGAAALTIAAPARGALAGVAVRGRLYGAAQFSPMLQQLSELAATVSMPVVASGGVHTSQDVRACLQAGAAAVQLDALLWTEPARVAEIAAAFS